MYSKNFQFSCNLCSCCLMTGHTRSSLSLNKRRNSNYSLSHALRNVGWDFGQVVQTLFPSENIFTNSIQQMKTVWFFYNSVNGAFIGWGIHCVIFPSRRTHFICNILCEEKKCPQKIIVMTESDELLYLIIECINILSKPVAFLSSNAFSHRHVKYSSVACKFSTHRHMLNYLTYCYQVDWTKTLTIFLQQSFTIICWCKINVLCDLN